MSDPSPWSDAAIAGDETAVLAAEARQNLARCEQEIATIKTRLRNLGQPSDSEEPNTLTITWIEIDGLPESAAPKLILQLSSPIETAELTKVYKKATPVPAPTTTESDATGDEIVTTESATTDGTTTTEKPDEETEPTKSETEDITASGVLVEPPNETTTDATTTTTSEAAPPPTTSTQDNDGAVITFQGVETGQATLSLEAFDLDIPLGSSVAYDLAPYTSQLLKENDADVYSAELPIAIFPPSTNSSTTATASTASEEGGVEDDDEEDAVLQLALCTVTVKIDYKPSAKDKREELYDLLNKASEKKAMAIEQLRQSAMATARARTSAPSSESSVTVSKPTVKPGFLNKPTKAAPKETLATRAIALYDRHLGPNSFLRRYLPIAKNYILFFGFLAFSHFKGHLLALPQPV